MEHCHISPQALSTEMWLDDEENLALYERAWDWLAAPVTGVGE